MAYLKLMLDEREIAHLSEDGQYLCANEGVLQYDLPLNLFIGSSRKVPLVDVVVWAKKRIFPRNRMDCKEILEMMGLPDYNAWEIVKRTAKTVTFRRDGQERRAKIYTDSNGEYIIPERYSMAPVFRASREYVEAPGGNRRLGPPTRRHYDGYLL